MAEYQYTDHLKEYIAELAKRYLEDRDDNTLPVEFKGIERDKLIYLLVDGATPILRKIEDDAIITSVERAAALIRYSKSTIGGWTPDKKEGR